MASWSACIVRSASSMPCGFAKPLDNRRSESFATRPTISNSSASSGVFLLFFYSTCPVPTSNPPLVVILLLSRWDADLFVDRLLLAARRPARRGFRGGVPAILAAADLLLRVQ